MYFVGIDLGTTNTVVAFAPIHTPIGAQKEHNANLNANQSQIFHIEQLVAPGEVAKRPMLPSFRYHPAPGEIHASDCALPWGEQTHRIDGDLPHVIIGEWARELGAKTQGRQVVSAKSWLSHHQVDRQAAILPWGGADDKAKVSPILASASYLAYIKHAWNHEHPNAPLEKQQVVITVPASFDEDARAYTVEAAKRAGLPDIVLLEEPQAVVYDWYTRHEQHAEQQLEKVRLLIVCDVGGGTTDLSLIKVRIDKKTGLTLERIGVGDHLMLGGDNIDLALATLAEQRLGKKKLSAAQFSQVIQQSRQVKERLLSDVRIASASVTVMGGGSQLIGGALRCEFTREEVEQIALNGFMPIVPFDEPPKKRRSAVVEFGLPYAADPAISKHLAAFLMHHQNACRDALFDANAPSPATDSTPATDNTSATDNTPAIPEAILYNGGLFNNDLMCERTQELFAHWNSGHKLHKLSNTHPHLAVAFGAVAYAKARHSNTLTIGGGAARSYFMVLDNHDTQTTQTQAVSILPKGCEEEHVCEIQEKTFLLTVGQPVKFSLLTSTQDRQDALGDIIIPGDEFSALPPLIIVIPPEKAGDKGQQEVYLSCQLSAVGTIQVACVSASNPAQRWQLEFETRKTTQHMSQHVALPQGFAKADTLLTQVFGKLSKTAKKALAETPNHVPVTPKNCRRELEKVLGEREKWDGNLSRALFDILLTLKKGRRRSAAHERLWFNLAGYCLRPGFGDAADAWRIDEIWPMYHDFISFEKETQSWVEWWTFWRRIAGGLNTEQQTEVFEGITPYADPQYLKNRKVQSEAKLVSYDEMVRLMGSLERVEPEQKAETIEHFFERFTLTNEPDISWWAIARMGTRVPFYASAHFCMSKHQAETYIQKILEKELPKNAPQIFTAIMLARLSGDRARDIDSALRQKLIQQLENTNVPQAWLNMLHNVDVLDDENIELVFGESLPLGLQLSV